MTVKGFKIDRTALSRYDVLKGYRYSPRATHSGVSKGVATFREQTAKQRKEAENNNAGPESDTMTLLMSPKKLQGERYSFQRHNILQAHQEESKERLFKGAKYVGCTPEEEASDHPNQSEDSETGTESESDELFSSPRPSYTEIVPSASSSIILEVDSVLSNTEKAVHKALEPEDNSSDPLVAWASQNLREIEEFLKIADDIYPAAESDPVEETKQHPSTSISGHPDLAEEQLTQMTEIDALISETREHLKDFGCAALPSPMPDKSSIIAQEALDSLISSAIAMDSEEACTAMEAEVQALLSLAEDSVRALSPKRCETDDAMPAMLQVADEALEAPGIYPNDTDFSTLSAVELEDHSETAGETLVEYRSTLTSASIPQHQKGSKRKRVRTEPSVLVLKNRFQLAETELSSAPWEAASHIMRLLALMRALVLYFVRRVRAEVLSIMTSPVPCISWSMAKWLIRRPSHLQASKTLESAKRLSEEELKLKIVAALQNRRKSGRRSRITSSRYIGIAELLYAAVLLWSMYALLLCDHKTILDGLSRRAVATVLDSGMGRPTNGLFGDESLRLFPHGRSRSRM